MSFQNSGTISICLGDEGIKIAYLEVTGFPKLSHAAKRDLHGLSETDLPKAVQSLLASRNVRLGRAIVVIPSNQATTKNIEIPSRDPVEIKSIINLQAGRHTPYSREEILVSFITIGVYQTNYTKVLLVIMNRNVVKRQITILEKAGLKIDQILFAPEGIARFYSRALNLTREDMPVGIIDIASQSTDFIIAFHGTVIANRSIPIGLKSLTTQGKEAREKLVMELAKSIESYQSEDIDKSPKTFILTGDDAPTKELQPILKEKFHANIKIVPYLNCVTASKTVLSKMAGEYNGDSFLDVIASAAAAQETQVDLMPEEMRLQKTIEEQSRQIIKTGILAVLILLLVFAVFFDKLYFTTAFKDKLTQNYSQTRQEARVLEAFSDKTRIIKDYLNSRMTPLKLIKELYKILPEGIYLETINLDDKSSILIRGTSESMSLVFSLQTALEASSFFKSVETRSTSSKQNRGKEMTAFEIGFKLKTAKEEKGKKDASKRSGGEK